MGSGFFLANKPGCHFSSLPPSFAGGRNNLWGGEGNFEMTSLLGVRVYSWDDMQSVSFF